MKKSLLSENKIRIVLLCLLIAGFLIVKTDVGVKGENVMYDARKMQNIPWEYLSVGEVSENLAAYIFYDEDKTDGTFSIYINRRGLSFGYFFRVGGSHYEVSEGITAFKNKEINEVIYMSLNRTGDVKMVEINDGLSVKFTELAEEPFAFILPADSCVVNFYDTDGNIIECHESYY